MEDAEQNAVFLVGDTEINLSTQMIKRANGDEEHLQFKFLRVLYHLARAYPNVISRDQLIKLVWQGNHYVGEKALTNAIWHIRKYFQDQDGESIQTVRGKGYRLNIVPQFFEPYFYSHQISKPRAVLFRRAVFASTVAFLVLLALYILKDYPLHQTPQSKIVSVTTSPGKEVYPSVSRDGKKLVYYWKQINKNQDIFYRNLDRPDLAPVQLTFDEQRESRPIWNLDASEVFFIEKTWDKKSCRVVALDVATRTKQKIGNCRPDVNPALAISNDGKTLAYIGLEEPHPNVGVYTIDLEKSSGQPKRFSCFGDCEFSDRDMVFSPDDKKFLMTRRTQLSEEDIFLVDRASGTSERLTEGFRDIQGMAWHANKNFAVFSGEKAQVRKAYLLDLDSKKVVDLHIEGFGFPSFIGNSDDIVFHDKDTSRFVSTLELNSTSAAIPFPLIQSEFVHFNPSYSPRSEQIAYISNRTGDKEIWVSDKNGTNSRQLTSLNSNITFPSWSPDGKSIAFVLRHQASKDSSIHYVNIETKVVSKVETRDLSEFLMPTWSKDSQYIFISAKDVSGIQSESAYYKIDVSTGEHHKILERSSGMVALSADEKTVWYSSGNDAIYEKSIQHSSSSERLLLPKNTLASAFSWLKTDEGIYFLQHYLKHEQINLYSFRSEQVSVILKAPLGTMVSSLPFSNIPEQNSLLLTQANFAQVDIKRLSHKALSK